jgi:hypothetical protein
MALRHRQQPASGPTNRRVALTGWIIVMVSLAGVFASSCSVVKAATKVVHDVEGNKAKIDAFTHKVQAGESATFEAVYQTSGTAPATVVYAVDKPNLLFRDTPSGAGTSSNTFDIIVNPSGEFECTPPSSGSPTPSCDKLPAGSASSENSILDFYTPSHWVTFLNDFALAAGFAGDTVTSSDMTVNGISMQCVDLQAPGVPGTSKICTTPQGVLGYVKVATDSTTFEIKSYSTSPPPASLFALPAGAKITTVTIPSTTT